MTDPWEKIPDAIYGQLDPEEIKEWYDENVVPKLCKLEAIKVIVADDTYSNDPETMEVVAMSRIRKVLGVILK